MIAVILLGIKDAGADVTGTELIRLFFVDSLGTTPVTKSVTDLIAVVGISLGSVVR